VGVVSGQLDLDFATSAHAETVRRLPKSLALRHDVVSIATDGNELVVAMEDPADEETLDRIRLAMGMHVRAVAASRWEIRKRLQREYGDEPQYANREDDAPAVRAVDVLHKRAVHAGASDIHLEPSLGGGRARLRVDGMLRELQRFPEDLFTQIVSRVKLLGGLDIADRRQPQDGRYSIEENGKSIDARVSSIPTINGEKVAIRLLEHASRVPSIDELGMPSNILERFCSAVHAPHGFIVVTGPTGSGNTTTLYAAMASRNVEGQNLCSVEDPVEVRLAGITQVQVNAKAGVTFASALRSFLRQDPNILMVGEMRDEDTASVAASAALSGQLVLTTLHSNDAPSTIQRLLELGVARNTIASALTSVVAQRLVRKICINCRKPVRSAFDAGTALGIKVSVSYEGSGCIECAGTGYAGRVALFEAMFLTDELRDLIASGASGVRIAELATRSGYRPMIDHAIERIAKGETTINEMLRVLRVEFAA